MTEITKATVERLLDSRRPAYQITVYGEDGREIISRTAWDAYDPTLCEMIAQFKIGQADVFGVTEFYDVPVEVEPEPVRIEISPDPFMDDPLNDSPFEITYRSDARTVLGNRPVDTLDDLMALVNSGQYIAVPVYAYVHGGVALRLGRDFHDDSLSQGHAHFDSGLSGYMLADKQTVREWYNVKRITQKVQDNVLQYMKDVLAYYEAWVNGQCWHIAIYSGNELLDCTSIYGDPDDELDSLCKQYGIDRDDIVDDRYE